MTPTSQPLLRRALILSGAASVVLALLSGTVGFLIAGVEGLVSALTGTLLALIFMGITALSIMVANRYTTSEFAVVIFYALVLGSWLLKFVVFIITALVLREQPWIEPKVFFVALIVGVIVSLVIDVLVVVRSRMPYVSDPAR